MVKYYVQHTKKSCKKWFTGNKRIYYYEQVYVSGKIIWQKMNEKRSYNLQIIIVIDQSSVILINFLDSSTHLWVKCRFFSMCFYILDYLSLFTQAIVFVIPMWNTSSFQYNWFWPLQIHFWTCWYLFVDSLFFNFK